MTARVGTSGWQYRDWRGRLYPEGLPQGRWLEHFVTAFPTVEVNNSFYRLPSREVFESWRARTPEGFVVTVKASRFLSHVKRLREPAEPVARLLDRAAGLGDRLGPLLLQLPPDLQAVPERLDETLSHVPAGVRVAVEPRHASWWTDEVREVLTRHRAALVWADRHGRPLGPLWRTADWGYLRLHEGTLPPWPHYRPEEVQAWADRLAATWGPGEDVYAYTNNDPGGAALVDARALTAALAERGFPVARAGDAAVTVGRPEQSGTPA